MNLLDLTELANKPKRRRGVTTKLIEKLQAQLNEQLSLRELVTALNQQMNVRSASYSNGGVIFSTNTGDYTISFLAGSLLQVTTDTLLSRELGPEDWAAIRAKMLEVTGVKDVLLKNDGVVIEFEELMYSPDLAASVIVSFTDTLSSAMPQSEIAQGDDEDVFDEPVN